MANRAVHVFKLGDKHRKLSDVPNLTSEFKDPVAFPESALKIMDKEELNDLKFAHFKMFDDSELTEFLEIKTPEDSTIKFTFRTIELEYRRQKYWANDAKTALKSRDEIYRGDNTNVGFVEVGKYLYVLVFNSNISDVQKIKRMFAVANERSEIEKIDADIFSWLFFNNDRNNKMISNNFKIAEMTGFSSTIVQGVMADLVTAKSGAVENLSATKLEIALNHPFRSTDLCLKQVGSKNQVKFLFDEDFNILLSTNETTMNEIFNINYQKYKKEHLVIAEGVYIFKYVIPKLIEIFNDGRTNLNKTMMEYRKDQALYLIERLKEANNIT